jgi:predicted RNA-binding protein YlxR (DUF448 family)
VRIVRTGENHVEADATGKKAGRGAYLCRQRACWDIVLESRGCLEHALKLDAPPDVQDLARLREFAATLPPQLDRIAAPQEKTE